MIKYPQEFISSLVISLVGIATWGGFITYLSTKLAVPTIL